MCVRSFCHTRDTGGHIIFSIWPHRHINKVDGPMDPILQVEKQRTQTENQRGLVICSKSHSQHKKK